MSWESLSGHFREGEMAIIENESVETLIGIMLHSDPIVALRVYRELVMHGDTQRGLPLVSDLNVSEHIAQYRQDAQVTGADILYANLFFMLVESHSIMDS